MSPPPSRSVLEQREYEAVLHVKESMQIAEDALMEKEQAVVREQQSIQEIGRLKKALATIVQEAGERTRKEVLQRVNKYMPCSLHLVCKYIVLVLIVFVL